MNWSARIRKELSGDGPVALVNGRIPSVLLGRANESGLSPVHLVLDEGRVIYISRSLPDPLPEHVVDLDHGIIFPCFCDIHTHLDKGHIWPRRPNPDGTFSGAIGSVGEDRQRNWSTRDVAARMNFSLECAYHHGTSKVRTHLDSIGAQARISWPVFNELRQEWNGRIELQAATLFGVDMLEDDDHLQAILNQVVPFRGVLGAVAYPAAKLDHYLDQLFMAARYHDLDLDFHADETLDPTSNCLFHIAMAAKRHDFKGNILVGHCCSLSNQGEDEISRTLDLVAETGIAIISLPLCNLYLQDRTYKNGHPGTPLRRGVTLFHEMKARHIPVMIASDNTRDPFYAYGDMDMLEVYREATRIAHLDHPVGDWPEIITRMPSMIGRFKTGNDFLAGGRADFVLMQARSWTELFSRPQSDRIVMRDGKVLKTNLPDYRNLDAIVGLPA